MVCVDTLGELVKTWRESSGMKLSEFARLVASYDPRPVEERVKYQDIQNLERGKAKKPRYMLALARAMGCTVEDLEELRAPPPRDRHLLIQHSVGAGKTSTALFAMHSLMRNVRPVWVVGRTQGGMPERIWGDGDYPVGATEKYAEVSTADQHAFACRIVGDSMVPRYMPGEFALVEPSVAPELEDDVLVRLQTGETMLKRLLSRRGGVRLGSYNSQEVLTFDEDEITWMYYVAHPIPARRIKLRVDLERPPETMPGALDEPPPPPAPAPRDPEAVEKEARAALAAIKKPPVQPGVRSTRKAPPASKKKEA